jgi:hypothetical protein
MLQSIRILPALLISSCLFTLVACQNRAPSLRMLEARSGYGAGPDDEEVALYQKGRSNFQSLVRKSAPRVARVYIYPHELPTKDYFWGGYVSLVVSPDEWILESPTDDQITPKAAEKPAVQLLPSKSTAQTTPSNLRLGGMFR